MLGDLEKATEHQSIRPTFIFLNLLEGHTYRLP